MISLAAVLLLTSIQQGPLPPYKRIETVPIFEQAYAPAVVLDGSTMFVANQDSCYAYDLRTSKRIWEYKTKGEEYVRNLCLAGGKLFAVTVGEQDTGRLIAFDAISGAGLWSLPRTSKESAVFATSNTVFADMKLGSVSAIDVKTRKATWTFDFPESEEGRGRVDTLVLDGNFLLVNANTTTYCLDAGSGKKQWSEGPSYMLGQAYLIYEGIVLVPSNEGSVAREIATGKELWRKANDNYSDGGAVYQGLFITLDGGAVKGVAPKTGEVKWSVPVGSPEWAGGAQFVSVVGDTLYVRGMDKSVILDKVGKVTWQGKDDEGLPHPIWTDGKTIVCFDGDRLLRYEHGEEDPLPTGEARAKLAEDMVARFDELDDADKRRLVALGDDAFPPLLNEYLATCAKYDAADHDAEDTYPLYSRYHDLGELLKLVTTTMRAADIMKAIEAPGSHPTAKPLLLSLLAQKGNPDDVTPYFLRELESVSTPGFEMYESTSYVARNYIVRSRDPRAVAFMLKVLRDPKADEVMRYEAYTHLAGTGGEEGVKAVLEQRRAWKPLRTIAERAAAGFTGQNPRSRVVHETKAADGTTWGLLQIGILGSETDLWLAKKQGEAWSDLVFLGVHTEGISEWVEPKVPVP
jgi:outer membrane protein assembly factor BamB